MLAKASLKGTFRMTSVFRTVFSFVLVCLFVASSQSILAQPGESNGSIVFRIGTFDRSSAEFAAGSAKRL
jgi:hypothetical protein